MKPIVSITFSVLLFSLSAYGGGEKVIELEIEKTLPIYNVSSGPLYSMDAIPEAERIKSIYHREISKVRPRFESLRAPILRKKAQLGAVAAEKKAACERGDNACLEEVHQWLIDEMDQAEQKLRGLLVLERDNIKIIEDQASLAIKAVWRANIGAKIQNAFYQLEIDDVQAFQQALRVHCKEDRACINNANFSIQNKEAKKSDYIDSRKLRGWVIDSRVIALEDLAWENDISGNRPFFVGLKTVLRQIKNFVPAQDLGSERFPSIVEKNCDSTLWEYYGWETLDELKEECDRKILEWFQKSIGSALTKFTIFVRNQDNDIRIEGFIAVGNIPLDLLDEKGDDRISFDKTYEAFDSYLDGPQGELSEHLYTWARTIEARQPLYVPAHYLENPEKTFEDWAGSALRFVYPTKISIVPLRAN